MRGPPLRRLARRHHTTWRPTTALSDAAVILAEQLLAPTPMLPALQRAGVHLRDAHTHCHTLEDWQAWGGLACTLLGLLAQVTGEGEA